MQGSNIGSHPQNSPKDCDPCTLKIKMEINCYDAQDLKTEPCRGYMDIKIGFNYRKRST